MKGSFTVRDHSISKEDFTLIYDKTYHMYVTSPRPSFEQLPSYYESDDYISHTDGKRSFFESLYQVVKRITLSRKRKLLQKYHPTKGTVLDIGTGTGDFLEYLTRSDWEVYGTEPNTKARNLALQKELEVQSEIDYYGDTKFDIITMWHVLEHVYDLKAQLKWLKEHLKEHGTLFVAVPNFESWDAQYYKSFWAAYDVPRHLYHFSEKAIMTLFKEVQLELVKKLPMKFDAYYVGILSEKYKSGRSKFIRGCLSGWLSNHYARQTKKYSSQIYVLKHTKT